MLSVTKILKKGNRSENGKKYKTLISSRHANVKQNVKYLGQRSLYLKKPTQLTNYSICTTQWSHSGR